MRIVVWPLWQRATHWTLAAAVIVALITWQGGAVHEAAGYVALAVAAARVLLGFIGPRDARFGAFVRRPAATLDYARALLTGTAPRYLNHTPLGAWMIVALLVCSVVGAGAGALYVTDRFWGEDWLIRAHAILTWAFAGLVPLHVGGVLHASRLHRENLIRSMIDGRKEGSGTEGSANACNRPD